MSSFHPAKDGGAQHVKTSDRLCRQEIAYSQLTNTLAHTHAQIYLETCTLTKTLAHKLTYTQIVNTDTDTDSYKNKDTHVYGSVSAGREKWPFNVLFFLESRASV